MIGIRPIQLTLAAAQVPPANRRSNLSGRLSIALATVAAGAVALFPASVSATSSALAPETLTHAQANPLPFTEVL